MIIGRKRSRRVGVAFLAAVACACGAAPARAATVSCGEVITADVVVENDLGGCPGDGLVVAGTDVTVDLNRHRISGAGAGAGIRVTPPAGAAAGTVTVTNGTVSGFGQGVRVGGSLVDRGGVAVRLERLTIARNGAGVVIQGDAGPVHVVGNRIVRNVGDGVQSGEDALRTVEDNVIAHNGGSGVRLRDSVSTIAGNTLRDNGEYGLRVFESLAPLVPEYEISGNVANRNDIGGISFQFCCGEDVMPSGSGNAARHNGVFDCEGVVCARNAGQAKAEAVAVRRPLHPWGAKRRR